MDWTFISADMAAESLSPARCRHFRTIKHFHGIPWRSNGWRWCSRGREERRDEGKEREPMKQKQREG